MLALLAWVDCAWSARILSIGLIGLLITLVAVLWIPTAWAPATGLDHLNRFWGMCDVHCDGCMVCHWLAGCGIALA